MAGIGDEARIPVYINDEQAKSALKNLTQEAEKWRKKMYEAMAGGDMKGMKDAQAEVNSLDREAAKLKRTCFDVDKVLNNLSSASIKDIKKAIAELTREQNGLTRGTQEYTANQGRLQQLRSELRGINGDLTEQKGILSQLKSGAMELLPAFSFAAIAAAAVFAFNKIISATDDLGTRWEASMNGMNEGLNEFWRTIASGDWSNFSDRIKEAIRLGEEYIYTLDDIEDKTRSMSIIEAESRKKELDLELKLKDKTLSKEDRIKAGEERIKLEEDLSVKRTSLAQETFDNEANLTAMQTKLTKDQLMGVMRDMDSSTKIKAKAYNDEVDRLEKMKKANVSSYSTAQGNSIMTQLPDTEEMKQSKISLDAVTGAVKVYAAQIRSTGRTTDDQLDKMVKSYVDLVGAQNSAVENTKKVRTTVKSLLAGQEDTGQKIEDKKTQIADKAEKKALDALDLSHKKYVLKLTERYAGEEQLQKEFHARMLAEELAYIELQMKVITDPNKRKDLEIQKTNKQVEYAGALKAAIPEKMKNSADREVDKEKNSKEGLKTSKQNGEYELEQYYNTLEGEKSLLVAQHDANLISEQEYQDKMKKIALKAEDEKLAKKAETAQKYQDITNAAANFVGSLMEMELQDAGDNEEKKKKIKKKYADMNMVVAIGQIVSSTALGIMQSFAQLGPIAGAIAATFVGATGAVQVAMAIKERNRMKSLAVGGYTGDGGKYEPAGIVHKGEYVIPQEGVNNPQIRPMIDMFELARRNNSLARLDLRQVVQLANQTRGHASGGYASPEISSGSPASVISGRDPELTAAIQKLTRQLDKPIMAKVAGYGGEGSVADSIKQIAILAKNLDL